MGRSITIRLLGDCLVNWGADPLPGLDSARLQSLLALLLLRRAAPQSRQYIAFQLWPEYSEAHARATLRGALHLLRARLPEPERYLLISSTTLQWRPDADFELDITRFEAALDHAAAAEQAGNPDELRAALEEAVGLYHGDLLPGCYDDWLLPERQRLRESFLTALYRLAQVAQQQDDLRAALGYAQQLVRQDPLHEAAYRHLMELYAAMDDQAAISQVYQACARVLQRELGVAPNHTTQTLYERLVGNAQLAPSSNRPENTASFGDWLRRRRRALGLTQEVLARHAGCAAITIRKLEAGSQKPSRQLAELLAIQLDLSLEERRAFVQYARGEQDGNWLAAGSLVPDALNSGEAAAPSNLPAQTTSFIGRHAETAWLRATLRQAATRLVTLCGPPGIGKTRLAQQVAAGLRDSFAHGVFFVPLAQVGEAELLAPAISRALGLQHRGSQSAMHSLIGFLRNKHILLVLDNLEQLAGATPLLAELLAEAPQLTILATSRAVLRLRGEKQFHVPLLALPDPDLPLALDTLRQCEGVALFVERAEDANPDFALNEQNAALVGAIVRKLEGLPLAIEIAAARSKLLQLPTMLAWLERRLHVLSAGPLDLPARQQTLRSAIGWSYDLLSPPEQVLFRRLGVFAGGCALPAVEAICADPATERELTVTQQSALDLLSSLVDKSLIRQQAGVNGESRFTMLETIREYALERLLESDEVERVRQGHADYYLSFAEEGRSQLQGPAQFAWLDLLEEEVDNLRTVLDWSEQAVERASLQLRLAAALARFWWTRGYLSEGLRWLRRCLERSPEQARSAEQGRGQAQALYGGGRLALLQGDFVQARDFFEQSLALYRQLDDAQGIATSLSLLGLAIGASGDLALERRLVQQGLDIARRADSKVGVATALFILSTINISEGDYEHTRGLLTESLALAREVWDTRIASLCLIDLGRIELTAANPTAAYDYIAESLVLFRQQGDRHGTAVALNMFGLLERRSGNYQHAAALLAQSRIVLEELGAQHQLADTLYQLGELACDQGDLEAAESLQQQSLNLARSLDLPMPAAHALRGMARVALLLAEPSRAWTLLRESLALYQQLGAKEEITYSLIEVSALAGLQGQAQLAAQLLATAAAAIAAQRIVLPQAQRLRFESSLQHLRLSIEEQSFARAWASGSIMPAEEAVRYALVQLERGYALPTLASSTAPVVNPVSFGRNRSAYDC